MKTLFFITFIFVVDSNFLVPESRNRNKSHFAFLAVDEFLETLTEGFLQLSFNKRGLCVKVEKGIKTWTLTKKKIKIKDG